MLLLLCLYVVYILLRNILCDSKIRCNIHVRPGEQVNQLINFIEAENNDGRSSSQEIVCPSSELSDSRGFENIPSSDENLQQNRRSEYGTHGEKTFQRNQAYGNNLK